MFTSLDNLHTIHNFKKKTRNKNRTLNQNNLKQFKIQQYIKYETHPKVEVNKIDKGLWIKSSSPGKKKRRRRKLRTVHFYYL